MPTIEELQDALINADKAGDVEGARALADALAEASSNGDFHGYAKVDPKADFQELPMWQKPLVAVDDVVRKIANGATFGFADKLAAKGDEALGRGDYNELLKKQRLLSADAGERAGSAGSVAEFGGSMLGAATLTGGGAMALVPQSAGLPLRLAAASGAGAVEGAGYGALDAMGHDTDVQKGASDGALFGAIGGPLAESISSAANGIWRRYRGVNRTPPVADLEAAKNAAYNDVRDAGAVYDPQAYIRTVNDLNTNLMNQQHGGIREARHPQSFDTMQQFNDTASSTQGPSMYDLDIDRQGVMNDVVIPNNNESHFGRQIVNGLDDLIGNPANIRSTQRGTPQEAIDSLMSAREANQRFRKAEDVGSTITKAGRNVRAKGTGETAGNEIRQGFKGILNSDTRAAGYSPEETGLMEDIVSGSRVGNLARKAADKVDGFYGRGLAIGAGGTLGTTIAGLPGATAGSAIGLGAAGALAGGLRGVSERSTRKAADELLHLVSTGRRFETGKANGPVSRGSEAEFQRLLMLFGLGGDDKIRPEGRYAD